MTLPIGDAFPEAMRKDFAARSVNTGSVIKIYDPIAKKEKIHLIVGQTSDQMLLAIVRINSEINKYCVPDKNKPFHIYIKKDEHSFLSHDSFVDCTTVIPMNKSDYVAHVQNNPGKYLGEMENKKIDTIKSMIATAPTVTPKIKKQFSLQ